MLGYDQLLVERKRPRLMGVSLSVEERKTGVKIRRLPQNLKSCQNRKLTPGRSCSSRAWRDYFYCVLAIYHPNMQFIAWVF